MPSDTLSEAQHLLAVGFWADTVLFWGVVRLFCVLQTQTHLQLIHNWCGKRYLAFFLLYLLFFGVCIWFVYTVLAKGKSEHFNLAAKEIWKRQTRSLNFSFPCHANTLDNSYNSAQVSTFTLSRSCHGSILKQPVCDCSTWHERSKDDVVKVEHIVPDSKQLHKQNNLIPTMGIWQLLWNICWAYISWYNVLEFFLSDIHITLVSLDLNRACKTFAAFCHLICSCIWIWATSDV